MMEILESFDKLMNALDEKYYARLLGLLSMLVYKLNVSDERYGVAVLIESIDDQPVTDEEKAIMKYFLQNPNIRPGVLASCYSRVIVANFKVHYSVR